MDTVSVIIATFGDPAWARRAEAVAYPSAVDADEIIMHHRATLAEARNEAAAEATSEWLCFLDADDQLEPGYLAALLAGSADLRAPAVRYVNPFGPVQYPPPVTFEDRNDFRMNPCVIGTLVRRAMFHDVGGFWNERAWEDWSLFRRCWLAGATLEHIPAAVYRANVNPAGRNSTIERPHTLARDILRSHAVWQRDRKAHR